MYFWESCEAFKPAYVSLVTVARRVELDLNSALEKSALVAFNCELRYVPIVMPVDMHDKYTERSRLSKKNRIYDCAPQLDYELFVHGSFEEQLREYVRGIALSAPHLKRLGATSGQVEEFESILSSLIETILAAPPERIKLPE